MTKEENNNPLMEVKHNIGPFSCCVCIKPQKQGFKEAICEVCDKVFTTDKDVYICLDCEGKNQK